MSPPILGAIIAGGQSTRYGSAKALAVIGGIRVVDRAANALRAALLADDIVAIVNEPELAEAIGLPHRPDALPGIGPLAGVHAALLWARQRHRSGVLALGCDMPFVEPALLREIVRRAGGADVVVPASEGRRGVEPLCAFYATACIAAIEAAAARGDSRMVGFHDDVAVERVPMAVVRGFGEPARMFLNINTPADRADAERRLRAEQ
jgi:molybdopterin-guanine dinucleotide biosynthesis protein A